MNKIKPAFQTGTFNLLMADVRMYEFRACFGRQLLSKSQNP